MAARCATEELPPEPTGAAAALLRAAVETDLQFYSRRAMEESRAAQRATCGRAASAHRYLAASYAGLVKRELETAAEFDSLARLIA
jgi:hypothetical protein